MVVPRADGRFRSLPVEHVIQETRDCCSIVLSAVNQIDELFTPAPGQFLTIRALIEGRAHVRCYSVSSLPALGDPLRITVKRIEGGSVSRWLHEALRPGDRVMVAPPMGRFVLRSGRRDAIFFAAGSGITPILPMIRHALAFGQKRTALFYWNRSPEDAIFLADLRKLALQYPDSLELKELYGSRRDPAQEQALATFAAHHQGAEAYVCGPQGFMKLAKSVLETHGFPDDAVSEESFASAGPRATPGQNRPSTEKTPVSLTVIRDSARQTLRASSDGALLESILSSGLTVPHSCREGHCGACVVRLVSGTVDMPQSSALSRRDRQKQLILACQARPTSAELEISYDF